MSWTQIGAPGQAFADSDIQTTVQESETAGTASQGSPSQGSASQGSAEKINPENLTVDDIKVEGNRLVPAEDILSVVKTKPGDKFNREKVVQDLKAINSMGYFDDRNLQVLPELTSGGILLKIRVQENEPVTEFGFSGNKVLSSEEISKIFSDQLGKPQNLNQLSSAIDKVEQDYHQKGYLLARVTDVKDDPDGSIGLTINEGVIDQVQIVGNHKTKDFIVRRAIKLKPGDVYNERELTNDLRKLYANGYFQDIRRSLAPSTTDPDKYILKVEVEEKRTGSVGIGGGVDTMAGPFGSLTLSDSNFRGRGQVLSFNSQIGSGMFYNLANQLNNGGTNFLANQRTYQIEGNFIEPNLFGTNTSMVLSAFGRNYASMIVQETQQRTLGTGISFAHTLGHHFTGTLGLTGQDIRMSDVSNFAGQTNMLDYLSRREMQTGAASNPIAAQQMAAIVRNQQLQGGMYATFNPSVSYDTRDNSMDPHKGMVARLTASPSLGITNASFMKLGTSVSRYVPVSENSTMAFNVQAGTSLGPTPQFGQYMLGGFNGLRGYRQFTDLGTGTSMLMATAEYRFKLPLPKADPHSAYGHVKGVIDRHIKGEVFTDAGEVAGNNTIDGLFQQSVLGLSTGVGVRINVPMIGVIRLDYGLPLISSALGGMTPRFTFGFGNKF